MEVLLFSCRCATSLTSSRLTNGVPTSTCLVQSITFTQSQPPICSPNLVHLQFCSVDCELMPADLLSEVFQGLSEFVIQSVLIALAFGWTIAPASGQSSEFFKSLSKPHEMFSKMSAGTLFTLLQLVLQLSLELSGRVYEDDFNQVCHITAISRSTKQWKFGVSE